MSYEAAVVIPAYNEEALIQTPLIALHVGPNPTEKLLPVVVVDNGSTDRTREIIDRCKALGKIDIHVVDEPEKGTGSAADTGFRYAIDELGADIIARLDADTLPIPSWFAALYSRHKRDPHIQLLSGPAWRGFDRQDRPIDIYIEDVFVPVAKRITRIARAIKFQDSGFLFHFAPGYNMSTTRQAYLETGGFPRSNILTKEEDVVYNTLIGQIYDRKAKAFERNMEVFHSSRRNKDMGYLRSALHYASARSRSPETVDHR